MQQISNAQIAFINDGSWSVVAGNKRTCALFAGHPFPAVDCPVICTTGITNQGGLEKALRTWITPDGVSDVAGLVGELVKIGGMVLYPSKTV